MIETSIIKVSTQSEKGELRDILEERGEYFKSLKALQGVGTAKQALNFQSRPEALNLPISCNFELWTDSQAS